MFNIKLTRTSKLRFLLRYLVPSNLHKLYSAWLTIILHITVAQLAPMQCSAPKDTRLRTRQFSVTKKMVQKLQSLLLIHPKVTSLARRLAVTAGMHNWRKGNRDAKLLLDRLPFWWALIGAKQWRWATTQYCTGRASE